MRFGDPATLRMLRTMLARLSHGKFSSASVMQLLFAHSQFAQSLHLACKSFVSTKFGLVFTPMQSILRSFRIPLTDPDNIGCKNDKSADQENLLELVKFIRVLFNIYVKQREVNSGEDSGINSRELVYLLLSSYGATCSEVDLEIYNLMLEIESNDESCAGTVAQTDYLWGLASLTVRKDREQDKDMQSADQKNMEFFERRKVMFRENIPVDPMLCARTVLHFPYNRFVNEGSLYRLEKASSAVKHEKKKRRNTREFHMQIFTRKKISRCSLDCLINVL
ncbi:hypothetical protein ACS0TY_033967 [Phlomoides rotata]